jgi:hypothetical protein
MIVFTKAQYLRKLIAISNVLPKGPKLPLLPPILLATLVHKKYT